MNCRNGVYWNSSYDSSRFCNLAHSPLMISTCRVKWNGRTETSKGCQISMAHTETTRWLVNNHLYWKYMSLGKRRVTTGWGDEHDVTHHYHTLFSQPPRNATSTHHDPRQLAMRIHHHDRGMATTTHKHPRVPSTTINERRWWPTGHEDPPPTGGYHFYD